LNANQNLQNPVVVQSLIGAKGLPFYLRCLQSLLDHCREEISLLIHHDGTLMESDLQDIQRQLLGKASFTDPKKSLERTMDNLQGRPHCQSIRRESFWGQEFFDPLFANPDDSISFYLDADILFLRPFCGLFSPSSVNNGALFLRDTQWDAYCLRPWQFLGFGDRPSIVQGITTAVVCWDKEMIDWEYLEWFLGRKDLHNIPEWVLPTAQAGLASRCQARVVSPLQLPNLYPNAKISEKTFGVHLLGSYREHWLPIITGMEEEIEPLEQPMQVLLEPCRPRGPLSYGKNQVTRWINTRLDRW
tara:strand:+ start:1067 stop:1972 length:906 start_codon:yes stop_codon:yes gene_type:complete